MQLELCLLPILPPFYFLLIIKGGVLGEPMVPLKIESFFNITISIKNKIY